MKKVNQLKAFMFAIPFIANTSGLFAKSGTNNPDSLSTQANIAVDTNRHNLNFLNQETSASHILNHQEAFEILQLASQNSAVSLEIRSSGGCNDKKNPTCTSLDGIRESTLTGVTEFLKELQANGINAVIITGATETGHSEKGDHTHSNGYKVDFALDGGLNRHIEEKWEYNGVRKDGAILYTNKRGDIAAKESDHWDITFIPDEASKVQVKYESSLTSDTHDHTRTPIAHSDTLTQAADSLFHTYKQNPPTQNEKEESLQKILDAYREAFNTHELTEAEYTAKTTPVREKLKAMIMGNDDSRVGNF